MKQEPKGSVWTDLLLFAIFVAFILLMGICPAGRAESKATDKNGYQVSIVNGIKFDWYPTEVKEKCPDLKIWSGRNQFYSSRQCAKDFLKLKRYIGTRSMSFKFDGDPKKLTQVELYEPHPNINANRRRRIYFKKKLIKKYGEPTAKYCGFKHGNKESECVEYFWEVGKTELMMHVAQVPDQDAYGIYFVWSKR